jgi:hypothetical protein
MIPVGNECSIRQEVPARGQQSFSVDRVRAMTMMERTKAAHTDLRIPLSDRTILAHMIELAGAKGSTNWSQERLAAELGTSVPEIKRAYSRFRTAGWIQIKLSGPRNAVVRFPWSQDWHAEGSPPIPQPDSRGITADPLDGSPLIPQADAPPLFTEKTSEKTIDRSMHRMREALEAYMQRPAAGPGGTWASRPLQDDLVLMCIEAGNGASVESIVAFLSHLYNGAQKAPFNPHGPKDWGWFPVVIGRRFNHPKWAVKLNAPLCDSNFERSGNAKPPASASAPHRCEAPFSLDQLRGHLSFVANQLRPITGYEAIAVKLDLLQVDSEAQYRDLEELERRLTGFEEEMRAVALSRQSADETAEMNREANSCLNQYRSKMSQEQSSALERQYLSRRLFERAGLPRLSLFYLAEHAEAAA